MTTLLLDLQKDNHKQQLLINELQNKLSRYQVVHKTMVDSIHTDRFDEFARGYNTAIVNLTNLVTKLITERTDHE